MFNTKAILRDVLAQDRAALPAYFLPDAQIAWHCSNERFTVEEYIRVNCDYLGAWDGEIERIEHAGDMIVAVTRVFPQDRSASFHVASFIRIKDGCIAALDEYWADDAPAPQWHRDMRIGRPIR